MKQLYLEKYIFQHIFFLLLICCCSCVYSPQKSPLGDDIISDYFRPLNEHYTQSHWTYGPTGIGNIVGGVAFAPFAALILPFELAWNGDIEEAPIVTGTISTGAHLGGFIVGTPFQIPRYANSLTETVVSTFLEDISDKTNISPKFKGANSADIANSSSPPNSEEETDTSLYSNDTNKDKCNHLNQPSLDPNHIAQWNIMIFLNGDNNLENAAIEDFLEMAKIGSSTDVNILVQFDRNQQKNARFDNWQQTLRFRVVKGMTPCPQNADESLDNEVNMLNGPDLKDFVQWGQKKYPAKHNMLVIWSHGNGWRNGPEITGTATYKAISTDTSDEDDQLYNREIQNELENAKIKLDIIGFDACLMANIETVYAMQKITDIVIASQDAIPDWGWNYSHWLKIVKDTPSITPEKLAKGVVKSYRDYCNEKKHDGTLSASTTSSTFAKLTKSIDDLAIAMKKNLNTEFSNIRLAREQCLAYDKGVKIPNSIDLSYFCTKLASKTSHEDLKKLALKVQKEIQEVIIQNYPEKERNRYGSHGLSIFFPKERNDEEFASYEDHYDHFPIRFVDDYNWDNFLHNYFVLNERENN